VRAADLLREWRGLAGSLPVHDLLDRIFHQADVQRYAAAVPARCATACRPICKGFSRFRWNMRAGAIPACRAFSKNCASCASRRPATDRMSRLRRSGDRVRMLTIHSAKGLEAPFVFCSRRTRTAAARQAYGVLLEWPPEADRPSHFSLHGGKDWRGPGRDVLFQHNRAQAERERLEPAICRDDARVRPCSSSGTWEVKENAEGGGSNWLDMCEQALQQANLNAAGTGLADLARERYPAMAPSLRRPKLRTAAAVLPRSAIGSRIDPGGVEAEFGIQVHAWLEGLCAGWSRERLLAAVAPDAGSAATGRSHGVAHSWHS
jgi:ATP-dependent helicase/nuclease subunit A